MRDLGVNDQQLYECKSLRLTYFFGKSICFLATLLNSPLLVRATSILVWLNPQRLSCSTPFLFSQMLQAKSLMLVVGPVNTLNLVYSCWSWLNTWLNLVEPCWTMLDLVTPACFFPCFSPVEAGSFDPPAPGKKARCAFCTTGTMRPRLQPRWFCWRKLAMKREKVGIPMKSQWNPDEDLEIM